MKDDFCLGASIAPTPDLEPVTCTLEEGSAQGASTDAALLPARVGGRYVVEAELGRGGMAIVHRVLDSATGKQLALKRLIQTGSERRNQGLVAAFEREFHTLVQLAHPRIIEVYDFGTDEAGLYYTMELLDGGDLRERAPLAWREACVAAHDVCSSLALLHARRLVHRDVSPRNVRSTKAGVAKLIDFGALAPMGAGGQVIGTPPFVAPEVLHRSTLDGRSDLFSLGATLYFALTGRFCYPARDFASLQGVWAQRPPPPSSFAPEIPAALDALVMSLIGLDPATRPRSAFEVMQRLAALAPLEREAIDVSQAYLSTPTMVGRDALIGDLNASLRRAVAGRGNGVLIRGAAGVGRTRVIDTAALDAKIGGAVVLRANGATESGEPLAVGMALAEQALLALPEHARAAARSLSLDKVLFEEAQDAAQPPVLKKLSGPGVELQVLQPKLTAWLLRLADAQPLAVLVDDLHEIDEASQSLLAALALGAARRRLFVLATARTGAATQAGEAFAAFERACAVSELPVLGRPEIEALVSSMFGDVPSLALLSERLYAAAAGNVRETLEIAQTLIARGVVRYEGGHWLLPDQLAADELPSSAAELYRARVAALSPLARELAETLALASHAGFSRHDFAAVAQGASAAQVDEAISELVASGVLSGDGRSYVLARREWAGALEGGLSESACTERHRRLASLYASSDAYVVERARHLLLGGDAALALDLLVPRLVNATTSMGILALTTMSAARVADVLDRALMASVALRRSAREAHEIRRGVFGISIVTDEARYFHAAPAFLAQLKHDSGLAMYESITDVPDAMQRLMRALTHAKTTFDAAPEHERVFSPEEAIKGLAYYVAISIAIGSRTQDNALIASLPGVLEPYAPLSPLLDAMWHNAIATRESLCDNRADSARRRWLEVDAKLATVTVAEMNYVEALRSAIAYGLALIEARLGISTAEAKAKALDGDPMQRVSAMSLRRVARLHKGDLVNAERYRKQAELLALHANQRQMFSSTLVAELVAHANAADLAGVRELGQAIAAQAARFPGWVAFKHLADGYFELVRGDFEAAILVLERGLGLARPEGGDPTRATGAWPRLEAAYIEALVYAGRAEEARACGQRAVEQCEALGVGIAGYMVRRALALAEAKLGDFVGAATRLEDVIEDLKAFDIVGLELGATYEVRTRVAIWASDRESAERFGRLTAAEYRYGQDSPLGARYERLWDEARSAGVVALPELQDVKSSMTTSHQRTLGWTSDSARYRDSAHTSGVRTERALQQVCEAVGARAGHLYMWTSAGFELVASHGDGEPDPSFPTLITERLTTRTGNDEEATVIETLEPRPERTLRDRHGTTYRTQLLMSEVAGAKSCAGAIILDAGARELTDADRHELIGALG